MRHKKDDERFEEFLVDLPVDHQAELRAARESFKARVDAKFAEVTEPFPYDEKTLLATLREPMIANWCHPLANLAMKLLVHHHAVDEEPFMIGGVDRDDRGSSNGVVCNCFYGTVRFTPDEIKVFQNWGEGNMCAETFDNLAAVHPAPPGYKALYAQLEAIAEEQLKIGCTDYNPPKKVKLRMPQLDESLTPGL